MSADSLGRRCAAIALVACALLLYEVGITRVLSVVVGYHFAFLSISLAMVGIGVPGAYFAVRPPPRGRLAVSLVVSGLLLPGSVAALFAFGGKLPRIDYAIPHLANLLQARVLLAVTCVLLTFLAVGSALCLLLLRSEEKELPRVYGFDLAGAAAGALLVVPAMELVPTPFLLAGSGALPLAALWIVEPRRLKVTVAGLAILSACLVWGEPFHLRFSKNYEERDVLYERWTPTARITVFPTMFWRKDPSVGFGWGMGSRYVPEPVEQLWIEQDGSAGTPITRLRGVPIDLPHLFYDITTLAFQARRPARVCVIGAGGGRDVLAALQAGASEVHAVELNRGIVETVSGRFGAYSGNPYGLPGVRAVISEGRSYLERSPGGFDVLMVSLVDSWSATSSGAFALSENYLYTVEALRLYLSKVSPDGWVSISRVATGFSKMEIARLVLMARAALQAEGLPSLNGHLAVVQADRIATVLLSRRPWTAEDLARIDAVAEERGFVRHWPLHAGTPKDSLPAYTLTGGAESIESYGYDLSPPTDDRPFFFQGIGVFRRISPEVVARLGPNEQTVLLIRRLLVAVTAIAAALLLVPLAAAKRLPRGPGFWSGSLYFAAIGLAYLLTQAPWVQRYVLYLGHPSYAVTVVLGAMLVGTGLGSMASERCGASALGGRRWLLPAILGAVNLAMGPVFAATLGAPFAVRAAIAAALVAPSGWLMGFAFPSGISRFGRDHLPWFWAVNGFAGVLAGVLSLALSMEFGLFAVSCAGVAAYGVACLVARKSPRRA